MAYVRERGNQLCIVHGAREPGTGKVKQEILFTIYSKDEALAAIEKSDKGLPYSFKVMLAQDYPDIRFDWDTIFVDIEKLLHVLPETYDYGPTRSLAQFYPALKGFAKALFLNDCQTMYPAAQLIQSHRYELEFLSDLIAWRLKTCDQKPGQFNQDNAFYWKTASQGKDVPYDAMELAEGLYEKRELDKAQAALRLLVECFDGYADGYNYLGLIQQDRGQMPEAIEYFRRTIEVGRSKLRRRIAKKDWWSDRATRPYMRGLMNLAEALSKIEQYDEALKICDQLEHECHSKDRAAPIRATIYLNQGQWRNAYDDAKYFHRIAPTESFVAAYAAYEMGQHLDALTHFVYAALNAPFAAYLISEVKVGQPKNYDEQEEHNDAVYIWNATIPFQTKRKTSKKFFQKVLKDARMVILLQEVRDLEKEMRDRRDESRGPFFDKHHQMQQWEFAARKAAEMVDLLTPMRPGKPTDLTTIH